MLVLGGVLCLCLVASVAMGLRLQLSSAPTSKTFRPKTFETLIPARSQGELQPRCDSHAGWGRGRLTLPKVSGNVDQEPIIACPKTVVTSRLLPVIKPTQLVMGDFSNRYLDGDEAEKADDAIALIDRQLVPPALSEEPWAYELRWSSWLDGRLSRCTEYLR